MKGAYKKLSKQASTKKKVVKKRVKKSLARKNAKKTLILYSANTWLAYIIAEDFYGGVHYVWCTPYFDPNSSDRLHYTVPPSSSPFEIYSGLLEDVKRGDRHSSKISENKEGIRRGVEYNLKAGIINDARAKEIEYIIENADIGDFSPLIYVIPYATVKDILEEVPVDKRANPLSHEFIIKKLPREFFDVILKQ
ncbi:MAG TPA: hypothetical protein PKE62_11920 [Anaerolineales bacterium]|nr:hypothetical protein [Anaerolineales bacterium]